MDCEPKDPAQTCANLWNVVNPEYRQDWAILCISRTARPNNGSDTLGECVHEQEAGG